MFTKALRAMGSNRLLNALRFKQPAAVQAARNFGDLSFCEDDFLTEDVSLRKDFPQFDKFFDDTGILNKVGQTPLAYVHPDFHIKLEGENYSGSIKDRVALYVLLKKLQDGLIEDGISLIIATSGSYGVSMFVMKQVIEAYFKISINLAILTPEAYQDKPGIVTLKENKLNEQRVGALLDLDKVKNGILYVDGNFDSTLRIARMLGAVDGAHYIDQQYDEAHVEAHRSTAEELGQQHLGLSDIVLSTGTGATASGIHRYFPYPIRIHTRPGVSGEISGLTDPAKYNNFFSADNFTGYGSGFFCRDKAKSGADGLQAKHSLQVGESSGAAFDLAQSIKEERPGATIAVISPSAK